MIEIYTNLFYTLSIESNIDELKLVNILMECLRQANGKLKDIQSFESSSQKNYST